MTTPIISQYTRAEAIDDGVLVALSTLAPHVSGQHFKHPIACTAAVWDIIDKAVANKRWCNDLDGVLHDILWMSKVNAVARSEDGTIRVFVVIIKGAGRTCNYRLKIVCGPGDNAEPVLTIMLPDED